MRNRQNRLMVCNYKTFDGCYCTKKRCGQTRPPAKLALHRVLPVRTRHMQTLYVHNFYCEKQRLTDKSFCSFCNKPTCEKLAHLRNLHCQSFSCVNTTYANTICSQLLLRKTAGKVKKFLQFLQRKHRVQQHKF